MQASWRTIRLRAKFPLSPWPSGSASIAATTLGETGGDAVSMSLNLGYLVAYAIFGAIFLVALVLQVFARRYHPFNYWFVIVATTTVGTTISDYLDRTAGLGYPLASLILFLLVLTVLVVWRIQHRRHFGDAYRRPEDRGFLLGHDIGVEYARYRARRLSCRFQGVRFRGRGACLRRRDRAHRGGLIF